MPQSKDIDKLTYEQAFAELQNIIDTLDEGLQPLNETILLFERGQALAAHCESLLTTAQLKVTELSGNNSQLKEQPNE